MTSGPLRAAALAAGLFGGALAAGAQEEERAPEFGALEGAELTHAVTRTFDAYDMPVGRFGREEKPVETIEGRVREYVYAEPGEASTLGAIRAYRQRFEELGYAARFECGGDACGGFDFRFGVFIVEPPAMRFDLADFRYLAMEDEANGRYASVLASRQGGKLFVQIVAVEGAAAPRALEDAAAPPRAPETKPEQARLYALARRLTDDGHAALEGIAFEAGSARLTVESTPALEQAAELLRGRPDLKFLVVGHTDNEGSLEVNLRLSRARAASVADRIAEADGVERSQLIPEGVAFLAPRASNATPDGRARNRRVELVIQ